jgi:16S rRNA (guanine527-N7)-methyltransferase
LPSADDALVRVLERARDLGFLGPGPVEHHLAHAKAYLPALPRVGAGGVIVDLGTGGGVPGVPLAMWRPDLHWVLVDAMAKRIAFVAEAAQELGLNVDILEQRAEEMATDERWSRTVDVVVARSLAAPAVAAEYAAPLLRVGGQAVIAEPPGGDIARWPAEGLAQLGMRRGHVLFAPTATLQVLEQFAGCPGRFPRRVGAAAKRPLF